jgi:hypothetical protein
VQEGNAPYLFDLLVKRQNTLIFAVALGVGLSTWLGAPPAQFLPKTCFHFKSIHLAFPLRYVAHRQEVEH